MVDKIGPVAVGTVQGLENQASIMAPATPFFFCTTQKHLTGKIVWNSRA
jgi:hypothetical protein